MSNPIQGTSKGGETVHFTNVFGKQEELTVEDLQKCCGKTGLGRKWNQIKLAFNKGIWISDKTVSKLLGNMTFKQLKSIESQYSKAIDNKENIASSTKKQFFPSSSRGKQVRKIDKFQEIIAASEKNKEREAVRTANSYVNSNYEKLRDIGLLQLFAEIHTDADLSEESASYENELIFAKERLIDFTKEWIKDGTISPGNIEAGLIRKLTAGAPYNNAIKLEKGEIIRGKDLSVGTGKLSKEVHKQAWDHFDEVSSGIVSQFPNINIIVDSDKKVGDPPILDNFNNYGLQPDKGTEVEKDTDNHVISFFYEGKKIIPPKRLVVEVEGLIFYKLNQGSMQYHDNALCSVNASGPQVITLCDGTGQSNASKKAAKVASETAQAITEGGIGECKTLQDALNLQFSAMKEAQNKLLIDSEAEQGTTFVQAAVTGNILSGVSVGDSKVFIFSQKDGGGWRCRDVVGETRATLDPSDSGGRLSGLIAGEKDIEIGGMKAFAVELKPGDVVYTCSDGGYDSFDPSTLGGKGNLPQDLGGTGSEWKIDDPHHVKLAQKGLIENFERTVKDCKSPEEMRDVIKKTSQERTSADKLYYITTPEDQLGKPEKVLGQGKGDDMATVFFQYKPGF